MMKPLSELLDAANARAEVDADYWTPERYDLGDALVNNAADILALIEAANWHLATHGYCYGCGSMPNHKPPHCEFPVAHAITCPLVALKPLVEGGTE